MLLNHFRKQTWMGGHLLGFSGLEGVTDFAHALTARTSPGAPGIDIQLPTSCHIEFPESYGSENIVVGDWFQLGTGEAPIQGVFLDAYHLLIEGPCNVGPYDPAIAVLSQGNRTLIGTFSHFERSKIDADLQAIIQPRLQWFQQLSLPSEISSVTQTTLLKALSFMKIQVSSPEGQIQHRWTTPDRWPHQRMWLWDSVFHAIGWRHVDPELARDAISAVLDTQAPNGFVAHMMDPYHNSQITQPPVLALGVKLVNAIAPDDIWLQALYPKLCAYIEWDLAHRDSDGNGLVEWMIEGEPQCRSGESGMDNSPRFDTATRMDAVDFNSFLALECEILAELAASLGLTTDVDKWKTKQSQLCQLIQKRLWSPQHGFFVDYDVDKQTPSSVLASSGFLPLICGAATTEQARQLAIHLHDPAMFGTAFPVPSIAVKDEEHYAKDMWRGPTWINLNWLIAMGFERYGYDRIASTLRTQTAHEIEGMCEKYGVFFEFYDDRQETDPPDLLRKGKCAPEESPYHQVIHDYGWTASLYVDLIYSGRSKA